MSGRSNLTPVPEGQIEFCSVEQLAAMGWRPGRHLTACGPSGAGKRPLSEVPELLLRLHPEPPEAA